MTGVGERAAVTFEAPHGTDSVVLHDGDTVEFGRGGHCRIRFGYAPVADRAVPRVAGRLIVANGRVFVESAAEPGHRAVEVQPESGLAVSLAPGDAYSPNGEQFTVVVRGQETWRLVTTVRADELAAALPHGADPPTERVDLGLTDRQATVLAAYCAPLVRGRLEPATHKEVADDLSYHPNTVREVLYEIWSAMFAKGVEMPDVSDKRVAVVEAARVHGLIDAAR